MTKKAAIAKAKIDSMAGPEKFKDLLKKMTN